MYYVRVKDNETIFPYSVFQFRKDFPRVSIPGISLVDVDQAFLRNNGIYDVKIKNPPLYNKRTEKLSPIILEKEGNVYYTKYEVVALNQEELNQVRENEIREVIQKRNSLLQNSDWSQLPDSPVDKESWKVYRQALRDITLQDGYPFEVIWPSAPA